MLAELIPGTTNVVRFPAARRSNPSLDLLRSIAPDIRVVMNTAEAFHLDPPWGLRHQVDTETAAYIAENIAAMPQVNRRVELETMLAFLVDKALKGVREWNDAGVASNEAQERIIRARTEGGYWLEPLLERGDILVCIVAHKMVEAHALCEEAEGAARAIGYALRGEGWQPFDQSANLDWLLGVRA